MIKDYLNYDHGLELDVGNTESHRGNENGVVFLAEYFILKEMAGEELTQDDKDIFEKIMKGLEVKKGLYDRGALDSVRENPKRSISHDNISAIASMSKMFDTDHAKDIVHYGLRNLFIYNNNLKGFDLPMNPGNYSIWLALAGKHKFLQLLFLPFFVINFIISVRKPKEDTSSKLLYLVELYPLRKEKIWSYLYLSFFQQLSSQSSIVELFTIYFQKIDHPNNQLVRKIEKLKRL